MAWIQLTLNNSTSEGRCTQDHRALRHPMTAAVPAFVLCHSAQEQALAFGSVGDQAEKWESEVPARWPWHSEVDAPCLPMCSCRHHHRWTSDVRTCWQDSQPEQPERVSWLKPTVRREKDAMRANTIFANTPSVQWRCHRLPSMGLGAPVDASTEM